MTQILAFIASSMGFLWRGGRFCIVGSEVTEHNGGDALLLVESRRLRLRFVCDRRQLWLDLQPTATAQPEEWWSIDLVRRLLTGRRETSALLDESYAAFLAEHLDDVEARFSPGAWAGTRATLVELRAQRARELPD